MVAHHRTDRTHHGHTDVPGDPHSPMVDGFWCSDVLWIFDPANAGTDLDRVRDLARLPELKKLDRYESVAPVTLAVAVNGAQLGAPPHYTRGRCHGRVQPRPMPRQPTLRLTKGASSAGGGEFLDGPDQVVAPAAGEAVGPEAEHLFGVGDGGAPEQHRGARECGAQMGDDPAGRGG